MKARIGLVAALAALLVSCGDSPADRLVSSLVDRFDAPECQDASPVSMKGSPGEDGSIVSTRTYRADPNCVAQIVEEAAGIGFVQGEEYTYTLSSPEGWSETVSFEELDGMEAATIRWELINP